MLSFWDKQGNCKILPDEACSYNLIYPELIQDRADHSQGHVLLLNRKKETGEYIKKQTDWMIGFHSEIIFEISVNN